MLTTEDTAPVSEESGDNRKKSVFSLVEIIIIVVICIFSIIVLHPVYQKYRDNKNQKTCMINQRQITASILMYTMDHEDQMPEEDMWINSLSGFYSEYDCPTTSFSGNPINAEYGYNQFIGKNKNGMPLTLKSITDPDKTLLIADYTSAKDAVRHCILHDSQLAKRHANMANVSYVDGHVALGATYQLRFPIKYSVPH